jgi:hypothetical protein
MRSNGSQFGKHISVLLNHVYIIISSCRIGSRRGLLGNCGDGSLFNCAGSIGISPVVVHVLVELLLGLSKPTIGPAIGQPAAIVIHVIPVVPSLTGSSSTAIPLSRLMLAWHVAINMVRRGFGDIAASVASDSPSTVLIASNCTSAFACWTGPPVISIPWSTDTVKKASFWLLDVVKWISAASPAPSWRRKKSQPNGLPLSVCAVKLANCSFSIVYVSIYDKGSALGATSTIIANIDAGDRSDSCEEALIIHKR